MWEPRGVSLDMKERLLMSKTMPQPSRVLPSLMDHSTIRECGSGPHLVIGTLGRLAVSTAKYTTYL